MIPSASFSLYSSSSYLIIMVDELIKGNKTEPFLSATDDLLIVDLMFLSTLFVDVIIEAC